jgi:hypothetical protein
MRGCGALAGRISVARVHRRRHQRADGMARILEVAGEVVTTGDGSIIESLPALVCRRARAWRCREVRGRACCGSCAAERETFVGWRLHLVCRPDGSPGRVPMLPAGLHDLTPGGTAVRAVRANNHSPLLSPFPFAATAPLMRRASWPRRVGAQRRCAHTLVRRATMRPHAWLMDAIELRAYRHTIETVNSQLEKMGIERLYTRTNAGFERKVHATLIARICTNMNGQSRYVMIDTKRFAL